MAKKTTSFRLEPETQLKLKILSARWEMPIGDVINGLLKFAEYSKQLKLEDGGSLEAIFNQAMLSTRESFAEYIPTNIDAGIYLAKRQADIRSQKKAEMLSEQDDIKA